MISEPRRFRSMWLRNTLGIGALALLALLALDGPTLRLALVGAVVLELWMTTAVVKSWAFTANYRWFWWWRR